MKQKIKILLAVDGSACSDAAVNEVAGRPWPKGSEVRVISAVKLPFVPTEETRSLTECDYSRIERVWVEMASASTAKAVERLSALGAKHLGIERATIIGDPREVILDEALRWKANLIVLGSRELGGFKRFLLGSVALGVIAHAPCSVRIVRGHRTTRGETAMKILLAVDGSICSQDAAAAVAARPWPQGSRVKIIYVAERPLLLPQVAQTLPESVLAQWQSTVSYAIDKARAQFTPSAGTPLTVGSEILHGDPKTVILNEAEKWGADLIVLGSHGMNAVERFLLGSVSQAVATHAKCSVEIVRCRHWETGGTA